MYNKTSKGTMSVTSISGLVKIGTRIRDVMDGVIDLRIYLVTPEKRTIQSAHSLATRRFKLLKRINEHGEFDFSVVVFSATCLSLYS